MLVVGDGVEPVEHFDQVEGGPVVGGEFVVAGGRAAPVFAPVEAAFDVVTVPVGSAVEGGPAAG